MNKKISTQVWLFAAALLVFAALAFGSLQVSLAAGQPEAGLQTNPTPAGITDDQVNAIAKSLYCPVCENIPLDVCPTPACEQWRAQIRQMLAEGKTEKEIKDYFVARYGDRVVGVPPARGLNWLVYIFPPLAIVAGIFIVYRAMAAWRKPLPQETNPTPPDALQEDEYVRRLEEELKKQS